MTTTSTIVATTKAKVIHASAQVARVSRRELIRSARSRCSSSQTSTIPGKAGRAGRDPVVEIGDPLAVLRRDGLDSILVAVDHRQTIKSPPIDCLKEATELRRSYMKMVVIM